MRVLIIFDSFMDGAGNIAQLLAKELYAQQNEVVLLLTNNHKLPRYNLNGITQISGSNSKRKNKIVKFVNMYPDMKKDIKKIAPDFIISFLDVTNILAAFAADKYNLPIIVCERSNPVVIQPRLRWKLLRRLAYKKANFVTVQFDAFKSFDKGRFLNNCHSVNNIVDVPKVLKTDYRLIDEKAVNIVAVGRLNHIKNYPAMFRIISTLNDRGYNATLDIYGSGDEESNLKQYAEKLGINEHVNFCGHIDDVHSALVKHDIYVMTSIQEGFPNALSEAMAVGLPVVSFCCHEGFKELIQDGNNGFLIHNNDEDGFVDCLELLINNKDLRQTIGERAKEVTIKYSHETIMKQWNALISEATYGKVYN